MKFCSGSRNMVIASLLGCLLLNSTAQAQSQGGPVTATEGKNVELIVGGLLANLVSSGLRTVGNWLFGSTSNPNAPCYYTPPTGATASFTESAQADLKRAGCQLVDSFAGGAAQSLTGYRPNTVLAGGAVPAALSYQAGMPNYQGLKVSALIVDAGGNVREERSLAQPFYSGEKFRLRLQSSFPGVLELIHTSPAGMTQRIFPAQGSGQFAINAGNEIVLPLEGNAVYEFFGTTGAETLLFVVRDPRAIAPTPGNGDLYQQNTGNTSYFAQPSQNGSYPYISQTIQVQHTALR